MSKHLVHLNNNMLGSLDTETSGLKVGYHEILQIAIIPLDNNIDHAKDKPLLDIKIKPTHWHRIDYEAMKVTKIQLMEICDTGLPAVKAADLLMYWFEERIKLPERKRIIPLGYNCSAFDMPFIQEWLGQESYSRCFHGHARDVMTVCNFLNDLSDFHAEQTPFSELKLRSVCNALGIEIDNSRTHDALYDSIITAKCYKKLLTHHLLESIKV